MSVDNHFEVRNAVIHGRIEGSGFSPYFCEIDICGESTSSSYFLEIDFQLTFGESTSLSWN